MRPFAELARGSTTSVFKAHDPENDRVVAVKLLRREWIDDEDLAARFMAEAAALKAVTNPNVVAILHHGESEDGLYIITEFVDGVSFDRLLAERTVPSVVGAFITREALAGLAAAHQAGIIHRDFKPANIVVGDDGTVKLLDFGFAESRLGHPSPVAGTMGFLAPELLTGGAADALSDIYSAGITLLQATTGVRTTEATDNLVDGKIATDAQLLSLIRQMSNPTSTARPTKVVTAIAELDSVISRYRPKMTPTLLAKWLAGDKLTLPRRLTEPTTVRVVGVGRAAEVAKAATPRSRSRVPRPMAILGFLTVAAALVTAVALTRAGGPSDDRSPAPQSTAPARGDTATTATTAIARDVADGFPIEQSPSGDVDPDKAGETDASITNVAPGPPDSTRLALNPAPDTAATPASPTPVGIDSAEVGGHEDSTRVPTSEPTGTSTLRIAASPWAAVSVDGNSIGVTPLTDDIIIAAGKHTIRFRHPQFPDHEEVVEAAANETTLVTISMWSTVARLHVSASPWAEVLVDGVVRDTIPMIDPIIIRPGSTILTLRHPELGSWSQTLLLEADSTYKLTYNLYELTRRD